MFKFNIIVFFVVIILPSLALSNTYNYLDFRNRPPYDLCPKSSEVDIAWQIEERAGYTIHLLEPVAIKSDFKSNYFDDTWLDPACYKGHLVISNKDYSKHPTIDLQTYEYLTNDALFLAPIQGQFSKFDKWFETKSILTIVNYSGGTAGNFLYVVDLNVPLKITSHTLGHSDYTIGFFGNVKIYNDVKVLR